ncbi:hypothetical protein ACFFWC_07125 [Plantactinospora siamensis]|uniref:Uncharacterized protein n=1 Tax=Plantactinospora siamensis TaxID=555372 RepID=A0ABV6NX72_9ACTN
MSFLRAAWTRLTAVLGATALAVLVPTAAWAASDTGSMVIEAAYRRRRYGSGLGSLCCLVVIAAIVLVIVLLLRRRRSGPPR